MSERDTVKVPPMITDPTIARERRRNQYAVLEGAPNVFYGIEVLDGHARRITPTMSEDVAHQWLKRARYAAFNGTVFPSFCKHNHLKLTPGICADCLQGGRP